VLGLQIDIPRHTHKGSDVKVVHINKLHININKVKIVRLDDNCSIAEPIDKKGGKRIRKDDIVYLADDEIAKIIKNRK